MTNTTRMEFFLKRLEHPKNAYAKAHMKQWFDDSLKYAYRMRHQYQNAASIEALRVRYVCNHMCPNLAHLLPKPELGPLTASQYMRMLHEYECENTQSRLADQNQKVIQDGIHCSIEEFKLLKRYVDQL